MFEDLENRPFGRNSDRHLGLVLEGSLGPPEPWAHHPSGPETSEQTPSDGFKEHVQSVNGEKDLSIGQTLVTHQIWNVHSFIQQIFV